MEEKYGYVYILTNDRNAILYTGVTSDLRKRISEHQQKLIPGFTKKYNVTKLLYYEQYDLVEDAIGREKQIKAGSREKKCQNHNFGTDEEAKRLRTLALIRSLNPKWKDLADELWPTLE